MKKDPKRVLESLRVDEEDPLLHHRPRKLRKQKNELSQVSGTALLSLCLVTGLSTGISSAFANTLEDKSTGHLPLDEPPSKVQFDSHVALPELQVPQTKSSELTPNIPPLDEPATNVSKQNEIKRHQKPIDDSHKTNTQHVKTAQPQQQQINPKGTTETPAVDYETKQVQAKQKKVVEKHVGQNKMIPNGNVKEEVKQKEQLKPKTVNGGELPHTAGDDLNGVVLGVGTALAGALLLKRKQTKTE